MSISRVRARGGSPFRRVFPRRFRRRALTQMGDLSHVGCRAVLDDRVRAVLARLEEEDARERQAGLPAAERSRAVEPTTGRFLFSLVAPQTACEVMEIGGSRGYSTVWLGGGVRYLGGGGLCDGIDSCKHYAGRMSLATCGVGTLV